MEKLVGVQYKFLKSSDTTPNLALSNTMAQLRQIVYGLEGSLIAICMHGKHCVLNSVHIKHAVHIPLTNPHASSIPAVRAVTSAAELPSPVFAITTWTTHPITS